jgi:hypothetical protein
VAQRDRRDGTLLKDTRVADITGLLDLSGGQKMPTSDHRP